MSRQPVAYILFGAGAMIAVVMEMLGVPALIFALGMYLPLELNTPGARRRRPVALRDKRVGASGGEARRGDARARRDHRLGPHGRRRARRRLRRRACACSRGTAKTWSARRSTTQRRYRSWSRSWGSRSSVCICGGRRRECVRRTGRVEGGRRRRARGQATGWQAWRQRGGAGAAGFAPAARRQPPRRASYRFAAALIVSSCRRSSWTWAALNVTDPPADAPPVDPDVPTAPPAEAPPPAA